MKIQSLLITLCVTTLTACAVDKNEDVQVAVDNEEQRRVEERVRQVAGKKAEDEYAIISMPEPKERNLRDDRSKPDRPASQNSPAVLHEFDAMAAIEQVSGDQMMVAKH